MKWTALYTVILLLSASTAAMADETTRLLAEALIADDLFGDAAVEYRRLALESAQPEHRSACFWASAYAYWRDGRTSVASDMLDLAEDLSDEYAKQSLQLRAEIAASENHWAEAEFYLRSLSTDSSDAAMQNGILRRLARTQLQMGDASAASATLSSIPANANTELAALETYESGRDKSPRTGGLMGIIPGLGYVYSGEYGNAVRSLILNALFIYGMVDTAQEDQWGGFGIITFFELTWYTGSIYGGFDAAHRYNQERLLSVAEEIDGDLNLRPDFAKFPVIRLRY
jgi:hypothetical protein